MQLKLLSLFAGLLVAASAQATPIVTWNGGTAPLDLTPGTSTTITIGITPDAAEVSGFNLFFDISDTASIALVSCTKLTADQTSCAAGGSVANVLAGFSTNQTGAFDALSFTVNIPVGATPGATITLRAGSNIDDGNFTTITLSAQTVARVVAVPEPAIASLLALGLGGLALLGRRRSA